ncbi:MAG TPA: hypothetical protein VHU42_12780, partial [Rhodopila sp.]|nr:hypothetical protein [Rhodopila sp.]
DHILIHVNPDLTLPGHLNGGRAFFLWMAWARPPSRWAGIFVDGLGPATFAVGGHFLWTAWTRATFTVAGHFFVDGLDPATFAVVGHFFAGVWARRFGWRANFVARLAGSGRAVM